MNRISEMPGYSATVSLRLIYGDRVVTLGQVAPGWIIAEKPVELPPGNGQVVVEVDGRESMRNVFLPNGMTVALNTKVLIQAI